MCTLVYISADVPLDRVSWNEERPSFYVEGIDESEAVVARHLGAGVVLHAGSHEGCGCGFQLGAYPDDADDEERALTRASLDAFAAYLEAQLERVSVVRLFACWDGEQSAPPEHQRALTPDSLRSEGFYLLKGELSTVRREPGSPP